MEKVLIKYEPFLSYLNLFSLILFVVYIGMLVEGKIIHFLILLSFHGVLYSFYFLRKKDVIVEISEEGINILEEFIKWEDVNEWRWYPAPSQERLVTNIFINRIEIKTEKNIYRIEGFNDFIIHKLLKKYISKKQRGMDLIAYVFLNCLVACSISLYLVVNAIFNK